MSKLSKKLLDEQIKRYYPNSVLVEYDSPESDLTFYKASELKRVGRKWFPLSCHIDKETGELIYGGREDVVHTYTEGETGAGKTTRFVMQSIYALASTEQKPSFVIVDIHGEIIENLYHHLKENGYDIKILNCDNPARSDTYNPFANIVEECRKNKTIGFEAASLLRKIAEVIQPVQSNADPIWDMGARSYTHGCILDKFEDLIMNTCEAESINIYNVIKTHYWIRDFINTRAYGGGTLDSIPHFKKKGLEAPSYQKLTAVIDNADKTRASYFGVVENHYDRFGQEAMYSLSSSNTINVRDLTERPTAIIIQSGNTTVGDSLISLMINDIYTHVVKTGKANPRKILPRNIHCFLDEFANCNIAEGNELIKMLTTSRKFGMFWHLILQCDAQLDKKYDANIAKIIRSNCTELFMGSHDYTTKARFSEACGMCAIQSVDSILTQNPRLETVRLMTPDKLSITEEGYLYIMCNRHHLTKTYFEAFYKCKEFIPVEDINSIYPHNDFDYRTTLRYPDGTRPFGSLSKKSNTPKQHKPMLKLKGSACALSYSHAGRPVLPKVSDLDVLVEELRRHLCTAPTLPIWDIITVSVILPLPLVDLLEALTENTALTSELTSILKNRNILKYEIIETFIKNCDFQTKQEWDNAMFEECQYLTRNNLFPYSIMEIFFTALYEVTNELSLQNIREVKKIISGI